LSFGSLCLENSPAMIFRKSLENLALVLTALGPTLLHLADCPYPVGEPPPVPMYRHGSGRCAAGRQKLQRDGVEKRSDVS